MVRTTVVSVRNGQKLELFVKKQQKWFEFWAVGVAKGQRTVLDHHLTHDDLEAHLEYAKASDLVWRDSVQSELPLEKHRNALEMEKTIKQGKFWDYQSQAGEKYQTIAHHLDS